MARLSLLLLLLPLLGLIGATAALQIGKEKIDHLRRIAESPMVQRLADVLGLELPDLPDINIDLEDININELAQNLSSVGCLPEGVQFSDNFTQIVQQCSLEAAAAAEAAKTQRRRQGGGGRGGGGRGGGGRGGGGRGSGGGGRRNGGRRGNRQGSRGGRRSARSTRGRRRQAAAMKQAMQVLQDCTLTQLGLQDGDNGLDLEAVNTFIDTEIIADDEFRAEKKALAEVCISAINETVSDKTLQELQVECIVELNKLGCMLAVADDVSRSLGIVLRMKKGMCLTTELKPPASAVRAKFACTFEELSSAMRAQQETESETTTVSRPRRDVDMMSPLWGVDDVEAIASALEEGPMPDKCRRNPRKCRQKFQGPKISPEEFEAKLERAEEVLGPLSEVFARLPERLNNIVNCWHGEMQTLNDDGTVDVETLQGIVANSTGPAEAVKAATDIISSCEAMGTASDVGSFSACLNEGTAYACTIHKVMTDDEEMTTKG